MIKIFNDKRIVSGFVFIVVFALMALVMMSGCNGGAMSDDATAEAETDGIEETAAEQPQEPRGNTPGNINQGGFVAASDGWVYFAIPDIPGSDDNRMFKMRSDGTEKQVLVEEDAEMLTGIQYINVIGDWIYYTSGSDIVKIRTDGSERTVIEPLAGAMYLTVVGDWIYYSAALGGGIYKIRVDGEEKTKVCDESAFDINVFGEWIYYINLDDDWRPYKVNLDGSKSGRLSDTEVLELHYHDGMLYYTTHDLTISKVSVDGGRSSELDEHPVTSGFNIDEGWIYHLIRLSMSRHFSLLRLDPDSGETEIIQEVEMYDESERRTVVNSFNIADGWVYIYAWSLDDDREIMDEAMIRVRTDGSGLEKVIDAETEIESAAHAGQELTGSNNYLVDVPALLGLDFDDALAVLDQHFSEPPTVEGPKEYMGAEITMYAYVDIIEDSLVAFSIGLGKIEGLEGVDYPPVYVAMGTFEDLPMDYDLEDLYRFTNIDPNAAGYSLEDIEVTDNLIEFAVHPKS